MVERLSLNGKCLRRAVLQAGGVCGLTLSLPQLFAAGAAAHDRAGTFGRTKRMIVVYLHGGHPQQETFDPKPEGPSAVRGEFGAIATRLPGVQFSELLPKLAQLADRLAVVRSMSHTNANHVTASLPALTGHAHPPGTPETDFPPEETDFPPFGAVLSAVQPATGPLPTWVRVGPLMRRNNGTVLHGQIAGFLGARHGDFVVDQPLCDPAVHVHAVDPADGLSAQRIGGRQDLLRQFDAQRKVLDDTAGARNLDEFYQRAFSLLSAPATREAFDLAAEPLALRQRYGWTEFGQRCVLARRLVEAGVPLVNVSYCHTPAGSWDTHSQNFRQMRDSLAPTLDAAMHGLITDLAERGLLDETLVVINAEFGRTPAINKNAGRDHWPWVYSLALCGAGVRAGTICGASDASAAYPADAAYTQADFAATLYHLLGVPADTMLVDRSARPHPLIIGKPIAPILA
jgi:uncharacterized protein (DUF1501 family)